MRRDAFIRKLKDLEHLVAGVPNTPFTMFAKVITLITMNMRYEKVALGKGVTGHPYALTARIIEDAIVQFSSAIDASFIEGEARDITSYKSPLKEEKHRQLFNEIWNRYDEAHFRRYIDRYVHRIRVNRLDSLVAGKDCVDLGCGNGNFCFALLERGAGTVTGIDFGEKSITYAKRYAAARGFGKRARFKCVSIYRTGLGDNAFDFAIQNGVFHHVENLDKALEETHRILRKGGWFWYYTTGEGSISRVLWDASVRMLKDVPAVFIEKVLQIMNVSQNKTVHLMDGLSATYTATSWRKITEKLAEHGFGNFKRLTGGFNTDFDMDRIRSDRYGKEKFGEGDLRILCQLLEK